MKEPSFRGYAAVASGLMLDRARADALRELVDADGLAPSLRLQIARALGLLADPHGVPALVASFKNAGTLAEVASTAEALGLIGDPGAVAPLLAVLEDPRQPPLNRGFAAAGLGLLAEKSDLPWTALFTVASNYRAKTPALAEIFDIL
jgi:HEAT repeat protein